VFALKALTGDKATAAELQQEKDPYWRVFLGEVPFQGRLDDGTTPFYTTCVDIPASKQLAKLFGDDGPAMDIKAELDKLAADADKCLAESKIEYGAYRGAAKIRRTPAQHSHGAGCGARFKWGSRKGSRDRHQSQETQGQRLQPARSD
jgi:hypothetical protein